MKTNLTLKRKANSFVENKGITLVALVITIIVLLILAGVAINMALDSDGLFGKANEAAEKWNAAVAEEEETLTGLIDTLTGWDGTIDTSWYNDSDNEFIITTGEGLAGLSKLVNEGNPFIGKTVKLGNNINLNNRLWEPIGQAATIDGDYDKGDFQGTFDGNGYTISNLKVQGPENEEKGVGLFGYIDTVPGSTVIKNLTIDGASVTGYHWTGVVVGFLSGTVENCTVKNATVYARHIDTACGDKIGGIAGQINGTAGFITGCKVEDTKITAGRDAGIIVGASAQTQVSNNSFENCSIEASGDCPKEANIRKEVIGRVL